GPSVLRAQHPAIQTHRVETAQQMYEAAQSRFKAAQLTILCAAVADYRPRTVAERKLKKQAAALELRLEKTVDIAATLGQQKRTDQLLVGFALETNNEAENARGKLERKNLDFIVLNSLRDPGAGFQHDTNKVSLLFRDNNRLDFELKTKTAVAVDIVDQAVRILSTHR
ncbi:MAG: phosphopantothenoylcysteine decarboxylase, partial [Bacteroidota bacterium]